MHISKSFGQYNLCSNEKHWCVQIIGLPSSVPKQTLFTTWPEDEEPEIEGMLPSEVVELISDRIESFFTSTSRTEDRKAIKWIRDNADAINSEYATNLIERKKKSIERLESEIAELKTIIV